MKPAKQEGVVLIFDEKISNSGETVSAEPIYMMRKNGTVKYYKLEEMNWADHLEFLGADSVQPH